VGSVNSSTPGGTSPTNGSGGQGGGQYQIGSNGGGGGGHASSGNNSALYVGSNGGLGGTSYDSTDLTTGTLGSGGGGASQWEGSGSGTGGSGGTGGGFIFIIAASLSVSGSILANGANGTDATGTGSYGGGGGGAGSILIKTQTGVLGTSLVNATGGTGGTGAPSHIYYGSPGGDGSSGRIHIDYYTSYTGTTTPTIDATQDNTLVTNTTSQLRLSISSTGSNSETLAQEANIQTGTWQQVGVSWNSSTKIATFYLNGLPIGTRTGTLGAIHDNASRFAVGASYNGAGTAANFYDGLIDEGRNFNVTRTDDDMIYGLSQQIPVNTAGLFAYYKFNGDYTDATSNANDLTATNSPVFVADVPFASPTTRLDIDQSNSESGDTYTVLTAISESTANKLTFTPSKDPQKSIQFNIAAVGSGNWTVTIHDSSNNVMATSTVTNGNLHTGNYEFVY